MNKEEVQNKIAELESKIQIIDQWIGDNQLERSETNNEGVNWHQQGIMNSTSHQLQALRALYSNRRAVYKAEISE